MSRRVVLPVVLALVVTAAPAAAAESPRETAPGTVPGELVVRFKASADGADRGAARRQAHVDVVRGLSIARTQLVEIQEGQTVERAIAALERRAAVAYAEPNWIFRAAATPNDPSFGELWGLDNSGQLILGTPGTPDADIDAPEAWDTETGDSSVVVAVTDTGVAYDHPDLAANMWTNAGETPGNGIDDDGNGYIDDVRGWDVIDDDNDPRDLSDHGTHVAGTIAAVGNNGVGVAGVAWTASIMPVRVLGADGSGSYAQIVEGFDYAGANGARVVNASLGGSALADSVNLLTDVVNAHPETLYVVAAGNGGADGVGDDNETMPEYPCNLTSANLICVAATTSTDALASFSNFGATSVDLGAPGRRVYSTMPAMTNATLDSFEGALVGNWTVGGTGGSFAATATPTLPYDASEPGTFYPGADDGAQVLDDQPTMDGYQSSEDYWVQTTAKIGVPGSAGCVLTYSIRHDFDDGVDRVLVQSSPDGSAWTTREVFTGYASAWQPTETYLGPTDEVYVRFRVIGNNDLGAFAVYDGVQVDDVRYRCVSTTYGGTEYAFLSGTSMATPQVAGALTILAAAHPEASTANLRTWLLSSGDEIPALGSDKTVTGRRLNLNSALLTAVGAEIDPVVTTAAATNVTRSGATLNGSLDANGTATDYRFEWGTTTAYGNSVPAAPTSAGSGGSPLAVSQPLTGLAAGTTFHYRIVALRNGSPSGLPGADRTFTTSAAPAQQSAGDDTAPQQDTTTTPLLDTTTTPPQTTTPIDITPDGSEGGGGSSSAVPVIGAPRMRLGAVLLKLRCASTCEVRARITAVKSLVKVLGRRGRVIASGRTTLVDGSWTVRLSLTRKAKRRLRRAGFTKAKGTLVVRVTDAAGRRKSSRRIVRVPLIRD